MPVTLAVYCVFTCGRLWLAMRRRLRPWFLALSVVVDIAMLMLTIWSFHLQYQAPPALSLKAPTLMYAFILIALIPAMTLACCWEFSLRRRPSRTVVVSLTLGLAAFALYIPVSRFLMTRWTGETNTMSVAASVASSQGPADTPTHGRSVASSAATPAAAASTSRCWPTCRRSPRSR